MKRTALAFLACTLFALSASSQTKAPAWKVELGEPVQLYEFLQEGKYLFFNSGPYAWLYNAASGEKVWSVEVKDYEKKGVHTLIGEKYVVGTDNALQCYDALTGKQLWSKEYKDIDQDEFRSYEFIDNTAVFWFENAHLAINLTDGTEIWRTKIEFNGSLVDLGTYNYAILHQQKKMLVMEKSDRISLFDVTNGKKVASFEDMEANEDLIKAKNKWQWRSADRQFIVVALDNGAAVIDAANNKVLVKKEFKIDGDYEVFFKTENGCAVFGKEKIVHFDFGTGGTLEVPYPIGDMRTVQPYKIGEQDILIISAEDRMSAIDLRAGKILWQSAENDPKFEGFAHRYIKQDGSNILVVYNKSGLSTGGAWLYAMSIDALTGTVKYQTIITISEAFLTSIARAAANIAGSIISFLKKGDEGEQLKKSFGYDNLGFNYEVEEREGNLLFTLMNKTAMKNPDTKDNPGEGFVLVNASTGAVVYKDYFEILYNSSWGAAGQGVAAFTPKPLIDGNIAYVCGNKRVIAFDLVAGKRLWTTEKELKDGYPTDIALYDGVLYLKFGKDPVTPSLDKNSVKINSPWENDPHGF